MKKIVVISMWSMILFLLASCTTPTFLTSKEDIPPLVLQGKGVPSERMNTIIHVNKGDEVTLTLSVENAKPKEDIILSLADGFTEGGDVAKSKELVGTNGEEKTDTFTIKNEQGFFVNVKGYGMTSKSKAEWKATLTIKPKSSPVTKYEKRLTLTEVSEKIGGQKNTSLSGKRRHDAKDQEPSFSRLVTDIRRTGDNSVDFQSMQKNTVYQNSIDDGEWTAFDKPSSENLPVYNFFDKQHNWKPIFEAGTSGGKSNLIVNNGNEYLFFLEKIGTSKEEVKLKGKLKQQILSKKLRGLYWDFKNSRAVVILKWPGSKTMITTFNTKTGEALESRIANISLNNLQEDGVRLAYGKEDMLYMTVAKEDDYGEGYANVYVFDDKLQSLSKPLVVYSVFTGQMGKYDIFPVKNGLEIWNVGEGTLFNSYEPDAPLSAIVNKFSIELIKQ